MEIFFSHNQLYAEGMVPICTWTDRISFLAGMYSILQHVKLKGSTFSFLMGIM